MWLDACGPVVESFATESRSRSNHEILVIGAGPSGLAAAASLKQLGFGVDLIDRFGTAGGAYARMYAPLRLSSPTRYLGLPGFPIRSSEPYLEAGQYGSYLEAYARHFGLKVEARKVTRLEPSEAGYEVTLDYGSTPRSYRFVIVATGMSDTPVIPKGIRITSDTDRDSSSGKNLNPRILHSREWRGIQEHSAERALIVGSGMRAVEIAEECARAGVRVVMSTRRGMVRAFPRKILGLDLRHVTFPVLRWTPRFLVQKLCDSGWRFPGIDDGFSSWVHDGRITIRGPLASLEDGVATFLAPPTDAPTVWHPDLVVLATGYRFETPFLTYSSPRAKPGYPRVKRSEIAEMPNLFFLGVPCAFGADGQFLHGMVRDAQSVAAIIARRVGRSVEGV